MILKKKNIFSYKYCLSTKEVLDIFVKSKQLVNTQSNTVISFYHIFMAMFMNKKLFNIFLSSSLFSIIFSNFKHSSVLFKNTSIKYKEIYKKHNIIFSIPLLYSIQLSSKKNKHFTRLDLLYVLFNNNYLQTDLKNSLNLIYTELTKFLQKTQVNDKNILQTIANPVEGKPDEKVLGRSTEVTKLIEILYRNLKQNAILVGPKGIGRFSIIQNLTYKINNNDVPYLLKHKELWVINKLEDLNFESKETVLRNQIIQYLKTKKNVILVFTNIEQLFNKLNTNNSSDVTEFKFFESILHLIEDKYIQCIGISTTEIPYTLTYLFESIKIKELSKNIVFKILCSKSTQMEQYYNTVLSNKVISDIIFFSDKYIKNKVFPYKAIELLDFVCAKYTLQEKSVNPKIVWNESSVIQNTISDQTGLPLSFILNGQNSKITHSNLNLKQELKKTIFGQDSAIDQVTTALTRAYAGLSQENRPIGSWLFCGISGSGKTELAKSLSLLLYGTDSRLIKIDMSEYMEKHSLSKLIGSPPGYIGYDQGGQLTTQIKLNPYSVVLFDEIEKAHPDINNIMLQILEDGKLTDSKGESVDFSHTLIIYTSNLGCPTDASFFKSYSENKEVTSQEHINLEYQIKGAIKKHFKPEFLNRLNNIVVFNPLRLEDLLCISGKFINLLSIKLKVNKTNLSIDINKQVRKVLSKIANHPLQGARPLRRLLEKLVEKPISEILMNFKLKSPHVFSLYLNTNINLKYCLYKLDK